MKNTKLLSFLACLIPIIITVTSFPVTMDSRDCRNILLPNKNTASGEIPFQTHATDISSFVGNYTERFREMTRFIRENRSKSKCLDVKYFLFTSSNPGTPQPLNSSEDSLKNSNFNPLLPTTVLVHGYSSTVYVNTGDLSVIKDCLLNRSPRNVILMDYSKYCQGSYTEAVQYSYLVSINLAHFVNFISVKSLMPMEQFHFIGNSLGAHISGNAGALLPGLGRISGIDPAGPLFELFPRDYRLSFDDALFVDVIHTGAATFPYGLGISQAIGHVDFYPNGGKAQPGCNSFDSSSSNSSFGIEKVNAIHCFHSRATSLFLESVCNPDCLFLGVNCDDYDEFQNGSCTILNSKVAIMGFNAARDGDIPPETKFYLNTNPDAPFCKVG